MTRSSRWCLVAAAAALAACGDGPGERALGEGVTSPARAAEVLRARLPQLAARALGGPRAPRFRRAGAVLSADERARFPVDAAEPIRIGAVEIRDGSVHGPATELGAALGYRGAGQVRFWTSVEKGWSEWLVIHGEQTPSWRIAGARPRAALDGVELVDAGGAVRLVLSVAEGYAVDGTRRAARLTVEGERVVLTGERGLRVAAVQWKDLGLPIISPTGETDGRIACAIGCGGSCGGGGPVCGNGIVEAGEQCDSSGPCCTANCTFATSATVCRPSAGPCDPAESCTGASAACPANHFTAAGTTCRASAGACDVAEACTGSSAACPADGFVASGTVCRASAGACDVAEKCSGASAACPADGLAAAGTVCRAAAGPCDVAEACSGTSAACPADGLIAPGTVCRAAAGACDLVETCTGSSAACPADGFRAAGTVCRASGGVCDVAEACTGTSAACPADGFLVAGTACANTSGCGTGQCSGSAATCTTTANAPAGTGCFNGSCLAASETCDGNGVCVALPAPTPPALATVAGYRVTALGPYQCTAINAGGTIIGSSPCGSTILIAPGGAASDLGFAGTDAQALPSAINATNQVVAASSPLNSLGLPSGWRAVRYASGAWAVLGALPGGSTSAALGVNDAGQIVGTSAVDGTGFDVQAFVFSNGAISGLATNGFGSSTANGINSAGQIAGSADVADGTQFGRTHAVLWSASGVLSDLGTLGGVNSVAQAVNDVGTVVGSSETVAGSSRTHAFARIAGAMTDLGVLTGDASSIAAGVNHANVVVGISSAPDGTAHAFVWSGGVIVDLTPSTTGGQRFQSAQARGVNDAGTIVGWGIAADGTVNCLSWSKP